MASIVVIDDDPQVRAFIRRVLEENGHEVREAVNGADGIRVHRLRQADLILCDIFMPEKEGLETIRQLVSESPGLKVVAMSGGNKYAGGQTFLEMAKEFGAAGALPKPLDRGTLIGTVRAVLGA
jgi:CheY-like chemotaxis protein